MTPSGPLPRFPDIAWPQAAGGGLVGIAATLLLAGALAVRSPPEYVVHAVDDGSPESRAVELRIGDVRPRVRQSIPLDPGGPERLVLFEPVAENGEALLTVGTREGSRFVESARVRIERSGESRTCAILVELDRGRARIGTCHSPLFYE